MKKQKILIVHNYYQVPGGEDSVVENEKNMLLENGHEVILYTRHNNEIKSRGIFSKLMLPLETIFSIKTYRELKKKIKEDKVDIVHIHNTFPLISPSVYYSARQCKVPIVQTVHNFRLLCPGATFTRDNKICEECVRKSLFSSVKYKCYRGSLVQSIILAFTLAFNRAIGTYNKIDGYIALTDFNKKKLATLINKDKIFIKANFVKKNRDILQSNSKEYFLFLGRIDELKGVKLLVEAWKEINNSKLLIVGKGPLENEVNKYIRENNICNIELLGFKQKEEVMGLISNSKALIVPSQWYEGFPMTIVESLSLGTPVVAGDIGNLSTIIIDGENGLLFKYDNKEELIEKINRLENNSKLLEKLSNGAIESFNNQYDSIKNYELLIDIYNKCSRRN